MSKVTLSELVAAAIAERRIELGARGRPWDDDQVWPVYLRAVERRRKAVDKWLQTTPDNHAAESAISLGL